MKWLAISVLLVSLSLQGCTCPMSDGPCRQLEQDVDQLESRVESLEKQVEEMQRFKVMPIDGNQNR